MIKYGYENNVFSIFYTIALTQACISYLSELVWENLVHTRGTGISVIISVEAWSPSYGHSAYTQRIELKCISLLVSISTGADVYLTKSDINGTYGARVQPNGKVLNEHLTGRRYIN